MKVFDVFRTNANLIQQLCIRDIQARYRGSSLGMGWSVLQPLLMLAVYTLVFSQVFKARWGEAAGSGTNSTTEFAIQLFAGLIAFGIFADCASRAPTLITSNPNFVTKVVFPLEVMGISVVSGALFQALTSLVILAAFELITRQAIPTTFLLTPIALVPLALWCLAGVWLLSALGVYLRDLNQIVGISVNLLMYLTPVFYPPSIAPPSLQYFLYINPLTQVVSQVRDVAINSRTPSLAYATIGTLAGVLCCEFALRFFQKARRGFADVL